MKICSAKITWLPIWTLALDMLCLSIFYSHQTVVRKVLFAQTLCPQIYLSKCLQDCRHYSLILLFFRLWIKVTVPKRAGKGPGWTTSTLSACLCRRSGPALENPHGLLQQVHVLLILGSPEWKAVLQVGPYENRAEGQDHLP